MKVVKEKENTFFLVFIVLIVVSLLGALYWVKAIPGKIVAGKSTISATDAAKLINKLIEVPSLTDKKIELTDQKNGYHVELHYPVVALAEHPELARDANAVIATFASDTVKTFENDMRELASPFVPKNMQSDLSMRWSALLVSPTIISIRFDESEYVAGSAHPNNQTRILNYDMERHLLLPTEDLFASSSLAIPFLSEYSKIKLATMLSDESKDIFTAVTLPGITQTHENFEVVGITKEGLLLVFSQCQVAPCANGTIQIPIPLADLNGNIATRISEAINMAETNILEATPEETSASDTNAIPQ